MGVKTLSSDTAISALTTVSLQIYLDYAIPYRMN